MATISNLFVELSLKADDFNNKLKEAQHEAHEFEKNIKAARATALEMGEGMSIVGDLVAVAMFEMTEKAAQYGAALEHAAQRTGATVEELAKLGFAAEQSGSSFDGLSTGLKFLAKNMEAAIGGSKKQTDAFAALGISTKDLVAAHGNVNKVFLQMADRFRETEDGAGKTAVSLALMGRGGTELIPTLNKGSDALKDLGDEAQRLGVVMSDDAAKQSVEFERTMKQLTTAVMGVAVSVGSALAPMLTDLAGMIRDGVAAIADFAREHESLTKVVFILAAAIGGAGGVLLALAGVLAVLPALGVAFTVLAGPVGLTVVAVTAVVTAIVVFRKEIAGALLYALSQVVKAFGEFIKFGMQVADAMGLSGLSGKMAGLVTTVDKAAKSLDDMSNDALAPTTVATKTATEATHKHAIELGNTGKALEEHSKAVEKAHATIDRYVKQAQADFMRGEKELQSEMTKSITAITMADAAWKKLLDRAEGVDFFQAQMQRAGIGAMQVMINEASAATLSQPVPINMTIKYDAVAEKKKMDTAITEVKDSAGKIFDDMFIKGESVFSSLGNLLKGGALSLGRTIFEDMAGALLGPVQKAFNDFFTSLVESAGIKAFVSGLGSKLGGLLSGLFGGGGGAAGSVVGAGASAASGAAGAAAKTATGLASGLTGGLVSGAMSMVGSIIGGFIARGKTEEAANNTKHIEIEIKDLIEQIMWPMKGASDLMVDREGTMVNQLDAIWTTLADFRNDVAAARTSSTAAGDTGGPISFTMNTGSTADPGFVRNLIDAINKLVQNGSVRLIASEVRR